MIGSHRAYSSGLLPETGPCLTRSGRLLSILHFGIWNPSNGPQRLRRIFDQIRPNSQFPLVRFLTRARPVFRNWADLGHFRPYFLRFLKIRPRIRNKLGGATSISVLPFFKSPRLQQEIHTWKRRFVQGPGTVHAGTKPMKSAKTEQALTGGC